MDALKNPDEAKLVQIPHDDIERGVASALDELQNEEYDGVFCVNNNIAKALIRELSNRGESLDEVKIISFDDIEVFDIVNPKISAIAQPVSEIGKAAVNLLIDRFKNEEGHVPKHMVLDTMLVER